MITIQLQKLGQGFGVSDAILDGMIRRIVRVAKPRLVIGIDGKTGRRQRLKVELPIDQRRGARLSAVNQD